MKKIFFSSLVIGVSAIIIVGGTIAYFSDTAMSEGNTFSTGNADLKIRMSDTGCYSWSDSCPGKTWTGLYPGWSDSYNVYLKNESASPIILKIIPYIEETGSDQNLWENCYMEITWSDNSHSTGRQSLEDWKTNNTIELEPRLNQNQSAGPWVVHFDIPGSVGNEIANASIKFNLIFNAIQVVDEEGECQVNADCEDNNDCTDDLCINNTCQYSPAPDGTACEDGDMCTVGDVCSLGQCIGQYPLDCDDDNVCTTDICADGSCQYMNNSMTCDDGNACTIDDVCADGACVGGLPRNCNDYNQCTIDSCDSILGCINNPQDGMSCDDGIYCNGSDTCLDGVCSVHSGDPCPGPDGDNDCSESCNEVSDDCTADDPDGSACDNGLCQSGICQPTCVPTTEVCDGVDNDCDGIVDEGLTGQLCSNQLGVCSGSRESCNGVAGWAPCGANDYFSYAASHGFIYEQIEAICDGSDNDCNGVVDDGIIIDMCPLTANVLSTVCSSGSCEITACVQGYFDSDGIYGNGCESTS